MTLPLIVIRPEPGNAATIAAARAQGIDAHGFAMFAIVPQSWEVPPPDTVDALLIASANATRHAGPELAAFAGKPAYAVGAASAAAARAVGLDVVQVGQGGLADVARALAPAHRRVLRLAARDRIELVAPQGHSIIERITYASEAQPMPAPLVMLLLARALPGAVVALHSARAAGHFVAECAEYAIPTRRLRLACLSPAVLGAAGQGWGTAQAAALPDEASLLALAAQMCQM